jgi:hypothetical protein
MNVARLDEGEGLFAPVLPGARRRALWLAHNQPGVSAFLNGLIRALAGTVVLTMFTDVAGFMSLPGLATFFLLQVWCGENGNAP